MDQFSLSHRQKVPFVCFACRVAVKLALPFYHEECSNERCFGGKHTQCPRCKKPMDYVGRYFKVPPRSASAQWRKAELLWQNGWRADGYSESPQTLRDARAFIQKPNAKVLLRSTQRRADVEERWRRLRIKREHLRRHKAA